MLSGFCMKKFSFNLVPTVVLAILVQLLFTWLLDQYLPWWHVIVIGFVVHLLIKSSSVWQAFGSGFLGIGAVWLGYSLLIDLSSTYNLSAQIAEILHLPTVLLGVITALIGGISGGLGAACGYLLRQIFVPKQKYSGGYYDRKYY